MHKLHRDQVRRHHAYRVHGDVGVVLDDLADVSELLLEIRTPDLVQSHGWQLLLIVDRRHLLLSVAHAHDHVRHVFFGLCPCPEGPISELR